MYSVARGAENALSAARPTQYNGGNSEPAKDAFMRSDLILGTAGHIDHGKTSLVKALTGIDCDRLPEEKARGITIDIGFATLELGDERPGGFDVPGGARCVTKMIAGAAGVDLAPLGGSAPASGWPRRRGR